MMNNKKTIYISFGIPAIIFLVIAFLAIALPHLRLRAYEPQVGDILFKSLPLSALSIAIEGATDSKYSHCGIVCDVNGKKMVLEAIGPVKYTEVYDYVDRARDDTIYIYRLKNEYRKYIGKIIEEAEVYLGQPYDFRYRMDDEAIYCSELIYKSFMKATGESLGEIQSFSDLKWEPYHATIIKYEGSSDIPVDRLMITPISLSKATQLEFIKKIGI